MVSVDKDRVVGALATVWQTLADLCAGLEEAQWSLPTECPGWDVKDNLSHIIGTELMLLGEPAPEVEPGDTPHVRNEIGRTNELWIAQRRPRPPTEVLAEFNDVTARRRAALGAMTQADFDAPSWTPAGEDTYGRFMRLRTLDCWVHEQDIRIAVGQPGHLDGPVVDVALDEFAAAVGFAVAKLGRAPDGARVQINLTGPAARTWRVTVADRRGRLVDAFEDDAEPTIEITTSAHTYTRLASGRIEPAEAVAAGLVTLGGDVAAAQRIVERLGYMP